MSDFSIGKFQVLGKLGTGAHIGGQVLLRRLRAPEFDHDCQTFQPSRPRAHRFEGGTHEARNAVEHAAGCENRDVGVGWNSACCP